jgi:hypothetical protein
MLDAPFERSEAIGPGEVSQRFYGYSLIQRGWGAVVIDHEYRPIFKDLFRSHILQGFFKDRDLDLVNTYKINFACNQLTGCHLLPAPGST